MPRQPTRHQRTRPATPTLLIAAALLIGACGSDDEATPAGTSASTSTDAPPATTPPSTPPAIATTAPPSTSVAPATATPTAPATPPATAPATQPQAPGNPFVADEVEVTSEIFAAPFSMRRAATVDDLVAYDGVSDDGSGFVARCVAVFRSGDASWWEWCREPDVAGSFVVIDGIDPWVVDVGAETGSVRMTKQPFDWAMVGNGCREPIVSIATAAALGPAVVAGIRCAATEALITYSAVFLQPGPADGGQALVSSGDEGWNLVNRGTSLDCDGYADGIDRCTLFESDGELTAGLPVPPADLVAAQLAAVQVADETADLRAVTAEAADTDGIVDAVVAALTPAEPESVPIVTLRRDAGWRLDALLVEVPLLDDSARAAVHLVWIQPRFDDQPAALTRAYTWVQCARGLAGPDLCI